MKSEKLVFRLLAAEEIAPSFLDGFERRQEVMLCYRRGEKGWEVRPDPFHGRLVGRGTRGRREGFAGDGKKRRLRAGGVLRRKDGGLCGGL